MDFKLGHQIGSGAYGTVYLDPTGPGVIKIYKPRPPAEFESPAEIDILFRLRSPHLLQGLGIYRTGELGPGTSTAVGLERVSNKLSSIIESSSIKFGFLQKILYGLAVGVASLHRHGYLHLDISMANCMYTEDGTGVLIDYGLALAADSGPPDLLPVYTHQIRYSSLYRPLDSHPKPGMYHYTVKSEVWALGMVYVQIFSCGQLPPETEPIYVCKDGGVVELDLEATNLQDVQSLVLSSEFKQTLEAGFGSYLPSHRVARAVDLVYHMLDPNPQTRYNMTQVLSHSCFKDLKSGPVCSTAPILEPTQYQICRLGIDYIVETMRHPSTWGKVGVVCLFNAIDLYIRAQQHLSLQHPTELALSCIFLSHRIRYSRHSINEAYLKPSRSWSLEVDVLKATRGCIRHNPIYDASDNCVQLLCLFKWLILEGNLGAYSKYPVLLRKLQLLLKSVEGDLDSKNVSIAIFITTAQKLTLSPALVQYLD